jgi:hypothetical protein
MPGYEQVAAELAKGTDPAMLCATCPWDRNCVNPPEVSAAEIRQKIDESAESARARGSDPVVVTVMATLVLAGRDTALQVCPVLAVRLRSADGRKAAEAVKNLMQNWDES